MRNLASYVFVAVVLVMAVLFSMRDTTRTRIPNISETSEVVRQNQQSKLYPKNKKYGISYQIYYINLDTSPERKKFMEDQFRKYGLRGKRVKGVYGKHLSSLIKSSPSDEIQFENHDPQLTPGEVGCTLAHLRAIKTAFDDKQTIALIAEDDCCFDLIPFWEKSLEDVVKDAPADWEILQLYSFHCLYHEDGPYKKHVPGGKYCYSNAAYIINKQGMTKLLSQLYKDGKFIIRSPIQDKTDQAYGTADRIIYDCITTYTYTIPMVFAYNELLDSTIHPDHTKGHLTKANDVISDYLLTNGGALPIISKQQMNMAHALTDAHTAFSSFPFFLCEGTLLGVYREGRFIEGDTDIDLGLMYDDVASTLPMPAQVEGFKKISEYGHPSKGYECTYLHNATQTRVDFFVYYPLSNGETVYHATYKGMCDKAKDGMCRWKTGAVTPLSKITFLEREYFTPSNPEKYLVERYGMNWNYPKKYGYFDGMVKGEYRGLITSDFDHPPSATIQGEKKISQYYPSLIRSWKQPIIWMYWQNAKGKKKPAYLDLCFETIKKANPYFSIMLLDDVQVRAISRIVHPNFTNIEPIAMRADYIRFCVLAEYGGCWIDADMVALQSFTFATGLLGEYAFVGFDHDDTPGKISSSFFACKPYNRVCLFLKNIFETEFGSWKNKKATIAWEAPTKKLEKFIPALTRLYPREYIALPANVYTYPVRWDQSEKYFWTEGKTDIDSLLSYKIVTLHNETYTKEQKERTREQVLNDNTRLGTLFRHVLGQ